MPWLPSEGVFFKGESWLKISKALITQAFWGPGQGLDYWNVHMTRNFQQLSSEKDVLWDQCLVILPLVL